MPSSPLPPAAARARPSFASPLRAPPGRPAARLPALHRPGRAWPGLAAAASAPHPLRAGCGGAGKGRRGSGDSSLAAPEGAAALGCGVWRSSSPSHPLPPLSTCGVPGQEEAARGPARRQLSVRSPAGPGAGRGRGGAGREGGGHSSYPQALRRAVERGKERHRRHPRCACVVGQPHPPLLRSAQLRESTDFGSATGPEAW